MTRRAFASVEEFDAWHGNAKKAAGLPIVGVNAATGEPSPGKQQTTDYTALGRDEDGNLILEAVVADERLAQRGLTDGLVRGDLLTQEELTALSGTYPAWNVGVAYAVGDLARFEHQLWECVQAHTSQADWEPPDVPALWVSAMPGGVIPEWSMPTGAHDAYATGDLVVHQDRVWRSEIDGNTTEPGSDDRWWTAIE